jgi:hypothetical protein
MIATVELLIFFAELYAQPTLGPGEELMEGGFVRRLKLRKPRHKWLRKLRGC